MNIKNRIHILNIEFWMFAVFCLFFIDAGMILDNIESDRRHTAISDSRLAGSVRIAWCVSGA